MSLSSELQSTTPKPETFKVNDTNVTVTLGTVSESVKLLCLYINTFIEWSVHINNTVKKN